MSELKSREIKVETEIQELKINSEKRIAELKQLSSKKLTEQIEKRKILAENKIEQQMRDINLSIKHYISDSAIEVASNILKNSP